MRELWVELTVEEMRNERAPAKIDIPLEGSTEVSTEDEKEGVQGKMATPAAFLTITDIKYKYQAQVS